MDARTLLAECHDRIRRHCRGLRALIEDAGAPEPVRRATARACARYFGEALPLHAADEEGSILPRLAPAPVDEELHRQHEEIEAALPALVAALRRRSEGDPAPELAGLGPPFVERLLAHIALEEAALFPRLGGLPQAEVVTEMRRRRGMP